MADNSPFILTGPDVGLPNSRTLDTALGLNLEDTGAGGTLTITPSGNLQTLANFTTQTDFISYDTSDKIIPGSIADGTGIQTVRSTPGVVTVNVVPNTTHQLTAVQVGGVETVPGTSILNFISSGGASVSVAANTPVANAANITVHAVVAASTDAKYILQQPDAGLPDAQSLSALATGILKSTTVTGVVSTAVAGTDYQAPSAILTSIAAVTPAIGTILVGDGTGFDVLAPGANNTVLTSNGIGSSPSYQPPVGGTGINVIVLPPDDGLPVNLVTNTIYMATDTSGPPKNFILPTTPSAGEFYWITGFDNTGPGWTVTQDASQIIYVGNINTTAGAGAKVLSTVGTDSVIIYARSASSFKADILSGQLDVI